MLCVIIAKMFLTERTAGRIIELSCEMYYDFGEFELNLGQIIDSELFYKALTMLLMLNHGLSTSISGYSKTDIIQFSSLFTSLTITGRAV